MEVLQRPPTQVQAIYVKHLHGDESPVSDPTEPDRGPQPRSICFTDLHGVGAKQISFPTILVKTP